MAMATASAAALRHGIAVERAPDPRDADEDARDRDERQLESRLEERRRRPDEEDERPEREEVPAVPRPGGEPRERREHAGDARADDGRLPADGEHVRADGGDRQELADHPRQPEQPADAEHARGDEGDVLPRDGEQVREPRRAELLAHALGQAFVLADDDAEHERSAGHRPCRG